jgi:putative transposase
MLVTLNVLVRRVHPSRPYDRNITDAGTLLTMIEYIHNNPVRRGLVSQATDWPWSRARF